MITALSLVGCTLAMISSWFVAHGRLKPVYVIGIALNLCFIAINALLAMGGESGVLLLTVPSAWGIVTSILGLRRLAGRNGKPAN